MAEEGWTGVDRWITSNDNSTISEQTVKLTDKGKCSAFGEAVIGSGRAEWDLTIEFESFGGISIGIYRQDLRDRDNINGLPTEETFTYTPNGYGYANKTGAFTFNRERKKYGQRYRHGDKITVRLDLQSRTLTFLINDESQGLAYDGLPKGAYRLAACMQFKEQRVSITRFWTSLGKHATIPNLDSTKTQTAAKDKVGKSHENEESEHYVGATINANKQKQDDKKKKDAALYADYKEPEIDPDAPLFGDDYNDEDSDSVYVPADTDDEDEDEENEDKAPSDLKTKSDSFDEEEKEALRALEQQKPRHDKKASIEDLEQSINAQYGQKLEEQLDKLQNMSESDYNADEQEEEQVAQLGNKASNEIDAVGLIGGRSRGLSYQESKVPEPLSIESVDEDATDYFSLSGSNLKTDRSSVTCTRQSNSDSSHTAFGTQLVSRGRIEWMIKIETGHSIRIGVCGQTESVDRNFTETKYGYGYGDDGNIYFGGSHIEYNDGFKAGDIVGVYLNMDMNTLKFSVNGKDHGAAFDSIKLNDKDNVTGYRLAVTLKHRPHKLSLLESTVYNVERRSPRPNGNQFNPSNNGHQRRLSYQAEKNSNKPKIVSSSDDNKSDTGSNGVSSPKKKKEGKKKKEDTASKKKGKKKDGTTASKKKGKKKDTATASKKKKGKTASSTPSKKKKGKTASSTPSKKKKTGAAKTGGKKKKKGDDEEKENLSASKKKVSKSKSRMNVGGDVNWSKRDTAKDKWEGSGPKLVIEKSSCSTKSNIKDGNSVFGKLEIKNKMKAKWDITIKQGDNIGVGVCNITGGLKTNKNKKLLTQSFTNDINGYGYMGNDGGIQRSGRYKKYGQKFKAGDKVSVVLDMNAKTLSFILNGEEQGIAFKNLPSGDYRLAASFFEKMQKITLNKTTIWDVAK